MFVAGEEEFDSLEWLRWGAALLEERTAMPDSLLVIDDDFAYCQYLRVVLTRRGFRVRVAHDALTGLQKAYAFSPDLILLDIMLPDMDGWEACRRLREMSDVPIIMLTVLGSADNVVQGLELGADVYLSKPVAAEELAARVRALLRRAYRSRPYEKDWTPIFNHANLVIDFDRHEVTVDHEPVGLSPTEFRLLSVFAQHKGRVLSHEYLLREVWGPDHVGELDYLRLYVTYLRRKIEKDPSKPNLIRNEWGVGYRFG